MTKTTCITCGEETTETVPGQLGDQTGVLCKDCQYWADGNEADPDEVI